MAESRAEWTAELDAETRWLSYHEIASLRGISRASAARMARLHRWPRRKNNSGVTVIGVPLAYAERNAESEPNPPERPAEIHAESGAVSALRSALELLRHQLEGATARADRLEAEARHEAAARITAEGKVAAFATRLAEAQAAAKQARAEAQTLAQAVNRMSEAEARRSRGLLARLRAAWRGE